MQHSSPYPWNDIISFHQLSCSSHVCAHTFSAHADTRTHTQMDAPTSHTHCRTRSSLISFWQVSSLTLAVGSPLSLLAVRHVVQHPLASSGCAHWARLLILLLRKKLLGGLELVTRCALLLLLTASFLLPPVAQFKKKKQSRKEIFHPLFYLSCLVAWFPVSLFRRRMERLREAAGESWWWCSVSLTCTLSVSERHSPPSQFKPVDYIHHVFRRYYPSLPPSLHPSLPLSLPHARSSSSISSSERDGWRGIERQRGCTSDDKVLPPEIKHFLWCSFQMEDEIPFHYCVFIRLLLFFPPPCFTLLYFPAWSRPIICGRAAGGTCITLWT